MKKNIYILSYFLFFSLVSQAQTYVNHAATGANDGTSWADAYTDLGAALNSASNLDEIWVAAGIYRPGGANPSDTSHFTMPTDVALYGGFNGTETNLNQRDPLANVTIMSGDLQGDDMDGDVVTNRTDNVDLIMMIDTQATILTIIDGFTFKGGHNNNNNDENGGAIACAGSPKIMNCSFENNYALNDGGALNIQGAGIDGIIIENCTFFENVAGAYGGAVHHYSGDNSTYKNCVFEGNKSAFGGAMMMFFCDNLDLLNCTYEDNIAQTGGALRMVYNDSLLIESCNFIQNRATGSTVVSPILSGGAIWISGTEATISSSIFEANTALDHGGAIETDGKLTIINSLIINNTATGLGKGGAIFNKDGSGQELTILNSTIANNQGAAVDGIYQYFKFSVPFLVLGNTILSHSNKNYGTSDLQNSLASSALGNVSNDNTLVDALIGNTDKNNVDPSFKDAANNDFHLNTGSPAHDLGVAANAPMYDLDGLLRVGDPDAGAYEIPFFVATEEPSIILNQDLIAYPNPPIDMLNIEINNDWLGKINFQMIDVSGRIIRTWESDKHDDFYQEQISVKDLAKGVYQVLVRQENRSRVVRFIKI